MESSVRSVGMRLPEVSPPAAPARADSPACSESLAAEFLRRTFTAGRGRNGFHSAAILGSGLGSAGDAALAAGGRAVRYEDVPGMPVPAVNGHAGRIVAGAGTLDGVLMLQGRVHHYEGRQPQDLTFAVRVLHRLGVRRIVITNAAGGIHSSCLPGSLMLIDGHLNPLNLNSLQCRHTVAPSRQGCRIWNEALLQRAAEQPTSLHIHRGVYAWMPGPHYETPAEVRMLRILGADAVGMSTVPEALCAAQLGMSVMGVSCITNAAAGLGDHPLSHAEVSDTAGRIELQFRDWLFGVLQQCRTLSCSSGPD